MFTIIFSLDDNSCSIFITNTSIMHAHAVLMSIILGHYKQLTYNGTTKSQRLEQKIRYSRFMDQNNTLQAVRSRLVDLNHKKTN